MISFQKLIKALIIYGIVYYFILAFILGNFIIYNEGSGLKLLIMIIFSFFFMIIFFIGQEYNYWNKETHEQKEGKIKKYCGELQEELALIKEAYDLESKIEEYKIRHKK